MYRAGLTHLHMGNADPVWQQETAGKSTWQVREKDPQEADVWGPQTSQGKMPAGLQGQAMKLWP